MSTRGESVLGLRARLSSIRARNFKKGRFGDIDLHRYAYHTASSSDACDEQLFDDAQPVQLFDLPVFIPSAEERLAMAIGHGGWDGHSHSDWLVDAARILEYENVDWAKFKQIVRARRLRGPAAIALSYLSDDIGLLIPDDIRADICGQSRFSTPSQMAAMLLAKDTESMSRGQHIARNSIASFKRLRHSGRDENHDTPVFRALTKSGASNTDIKYALNKPINLPAPTCTGKWAFEITVEMLAPGKRRRIEFELNGHDRNICHLQAFHLRTSAHSISVRFRGQVEIKFDELPIVLSALPGKLIESEPGSAEHEKYRAIPFIMKKHNFRKLD
jgi:hypothetical protein